MRRGALGLGLLLALGLLGGEATRACGHPLGAPGNRLLCCCQTPGGGSCCALVEICGAFVPGCFCEGR